MADQENERNLPQEEATDWSGTLKKILIEANEKEMTLEEVTKKAVEQNIITADEATELLKTAKSVDDFGKKIFKEEPEKKKGKSKEEQTSVNKEEKAQINDNSKIVDKEEIKEDQRTRD